MPNTLRKPLVGTLIAAFAIILLSSTAYTRDAHPLVAFSCADETRFTVEFYPGHVRLRHGAGVFSLSEDAGPVANRYSDGEHTLWIDGQNARLEGGGLEPTQCLSQGNPV